MSGRIMIGIDTSIFMVEETTRKSILLVRKTKNKKKTPVGDDRHGNLWSK